MDLENIRKDIDSIDSEITALFKKRMDKTLEVAKYKKSKGIPVLSDKREKDILHRVSEEIGEPLDGYARLLFNTIFDVSRSYQNNYMAGRSRLSALIEIMG